MVCRSSAATALQIRRMTDGSPTPAWGAAPADSRAKPQGAIPTLKMPTARGWSRVSCRPRRPASRSTSSPTKLDHPRWIEVLPNGDVLVAEAMNHEPAAALGLRLRHGRHHAARPTRWKERQPHQPAARRRPRRRRRRPARSSWPSRPAVRHGLVGETYSYVGNTDGVVAFPFKVGETRITGAAASWSPSSRRPLTRSLCSARTRRSSMPASARSPTSREQGMQVEEGAPAITSSISSAAAPHLRLGPAQRRRNGLGAEHRQLWTVVNERDGWATRRRQTTSPREGTRPFYGWPYCIGAGRVDDRVPQDASMVAKAITRTMRWRPHRSLGCAGCRRHPARLCRKAWRSVSTAMEPQATQRLQAGVHPVRQRQALGPPRDILSDFLASDEKVSYGRPVA